MTPAERIAECSIFETEIAGDMPWYSPSARMRQQNQNWACEVFRWAVLEYRTTYYMALVHPNDAALQNTLRDHEAAIWEQLENWEPQGPAN